MTVTAPKDRRKKQVAACPDCGEYHAEDQPELMAKIEALHHSNTTAIAVIMGLLDRCIEDYQTMHDHLVSAGLEPQAEIVLEIMGFHRAMRLQCQYVKETHDDAARDKQGFDEFMSEVMSGKVPVQVYRTGADGRPIEEDRPHDG